MGPHRFRTSWDSPVAELNYGDPFQDEQSDKFVARYVERGPLSLEKLSMEDDLVVYTTKDGATHEFETLECLALLSSHIPNTYESITRYYGYYSCRARGERKSGLPS
ncbi:MAG: transposase [Bdellovibrionales bacterium]|nr:transposase [Bdellovibrionales bacterium]